MCAAMVLVYKNQETLFAVTKCLDILLRTTIYLLHLRGKGGVPWVQIMENEFEYLADRGGHGGHLGEKFVKKYCS